MKTVKIKNFVASNTSPFLLIAGPCAIEGRDLAMKTGEFLKKMSTDLQVPLIYKSSFDKANRTSASSARGLGMEEGLKILQEVSREFNLPTITDVHLPDQCAPVAEVVDVLQIPAFLCRQTDLLVAAAETGKAVNVKKGQFLAPWDMKNIVAKLEGAGNKNILLCERGTSFGYNTLVNDFRGIAQMAETGYPVIFDATHSVQQPGGLGTTTGGQREFVPLLARAAVAVGVAGIFMETHPDPKNAASDGPNQIHMQNLPAIIEDLKRFDELAKTKPLKSFLSAA